MMFLKLFCFFFKQKTAYEMRISDWSSDVCSSDLDGYVYNVHTITRGRVAETGLDGRFNTGSVVHNVRASASWLNYKEGTANNPYTGWPQNKIGRASCRERVCQYV